MYDSTSAANPYFIINTGGTLSWGPKTAATDTSLYRSGVAQLTTTGAFRTNCATATSEALSLYVSGDAQLRLTMNANGTMVWGSGAAVGDTTLYRWTTAFLGTPNSFGAFMGTTSQLTLQSYNNGPIIYFGNAQDTNLYRNAVNQLRTGGSLVVDGLVTPASMGSGTRDGTRFLRDDGTWQIAPAAAGALPSDCVVAAGTRIIRNLMVGTDAQPGFQLNGDGRHLWGPGGSTATDTNLYRVAASTLRTDTGFQVGGNLGLTGATSYIAIQSQNAAANGTFYTMVSGDSNNRFVIQAGGTMNWSSGAGAMDTSLYRTAAGELRTDGKFFSHNGAGANYATVLGDLNGLPVNLTRFSLYYDTTRNVGVITALSQAIAWRNVAIATNGASVLVNGIYFGTSDANFDVNMYRSAAGTVTVGGAITSSQDVAWTNVAPGGGFSNYGGVFVPLRYRKVLGIVYVQGLIVYTAGGGSGDPANGAIVMTLPAGCRPNAQLSFVCHVGGAGQTANQNTARFDVNTAGQVNYQSGGSTWNFVALTFSFPADQ